MLDDVEPTFNEVNVDKLKRIKDILFNSLQKSTDYQIFWKIVTSKVPNHAEQNKIEDFIANAYAYRVMSTIQATNPLASKMVKFIATVFNSSATTSELVHQEQDRIIQNTVTNAFVAGSKTTEGPILKLYANNIHNALTFLIGAVNEKNVYEVGGLRVNLNKLYEQIEGRYKLIDFHQLGDRGIIEVNEALKKYLGDISKLSQEASINKEHLRVVLAVTAEVILEHLHQHIMNQPMSAEVVNSTSTLLALVAAYRDQHLLPDYAQFNKELNLAEMNAKLKQHDLQPIASDSKVNRHQVQYQKVALKSEEDTASKPAGIRRRSGSLDLQASSGLRASASSLRSSASRLTKAETDSEKEKEKEKKSKKPHQP